MCILSLRHCLNLSRHNTMSTYYIANVYANTDIKIYNIDLGKEFSHKLTIFLRDLHIEV